MIGKQHECVEANLTQGRSRERESPKRVNREEKRNLSSSKYSSFSGQKKSMKESKNDELENGG